MATKEYREFFLRDTQSNNGSKKDQEYGFPVTVIVNGQNVKNRFLKGHFPSEDVNKKLFESICFKLNAEDRATALQYGLVIAIEDAWDRYNEDLPITSFVNPNQLFQLIDEQFKSSSDLADEESNNLRLLSRPGVRIRHYYDVNNKEKLSYDKAPTIKTFSYGTEIGDDETLSFTLTGFSGEPFLSQPYDVLELDFVVTLVTGEDPKVITIVYDGVSYPYTVTNVEDAATVRIRIVITKINSTTCYEKKCVQEFNSTGEIVSEINLFGTKTPTDLNSVIGLDVSIVCDAPNQSDATVCVEARYLPCYID